MAENAGPDSPSREAALQASYLFRDLPPTERTELAARIRWRRYPRGTYVFRVGDPADGIVILVSGAIQGSRTGPDGEEYVDMVVSQAGDIVGETAALIEGELRMMDGLVTEDTEVGLLPSADLFALLEADNVVMRRMVARLAELVRERSRFMAGMSFLDTTGRVAAKLLELSAINDPLKTQRERIVRVPQRVLAGMVLASRESVNRALATLSAEGAIKVEAGGIVVSDANLLRRRAGYDHLRP